jgi:protocatechuate 3,4-dioxygenase beta subunit
MVSGVDSLTVPLNPSIFSSPSSDAAYIAFPSPDAPTSASQPLSDSSSSASTRFSVFVSKLRPYRRWIIGGSVAVVVLLIAAAFILRGGGSHHQSGGGPVNPGSNPSAGGGGGGNSSCPQTVIETEGPYWVDEKLNRSDLAATAQGLNLAMELLVFNSTVANKCIPIVGAMVDVWHADALGLYSDEEILKTKGKTFLRGYQTTNSEGLVSFLTIWPGFYSGRTIHIHVRVRVYDASGKIIHNQTTQLFFDDAINDAVIATAPYNTKSAKRDTWNNKDNLYHSSLLMNVTGNTKSGYAGSFAFGVPFVR